MSTSLNIHSVSIVPIDKSYPFWTRFLEILPIVVLSMVSFLMYKFTSPLSSRRYLKLFCIMGTILSYMLISVHWVSESNWIVVSPAVRDIGKILAPRLVYSIGFGLLILFVLSRIFYPKETASNSTEWLAIATMAMISAWSSIILILLGKQGALVALVCIVGGTLWPLNLNNISFYSGI